MPFRIREQAETWFSEIEGREPLKTKFDIYYFCLMAGLTSGEYRDPHATGYLTRDFNNAFVSDYRPSQRLLLGLLVIAELKRYSIDVTEKGSVRQVFKRLISPGDTGLTEAGMVAMNGYASGGYEFMAAARTARPSSPEDFLRDYLKLMAEAAATT